MRIFIKTPFAHAENIDHCKQDKDRCNGDDAECHADAVAPHALLTGMKIAGIAMVAVVATTIASTMRNFTRPSTA